MDQRLIELCAEAAHRTLRCFDVAIRRLSPPWANLDDDDRENLLTAAKAIVSQGSSAEDVAPLVCGRAWEACLASQRARASLFRETVLGLWKHLMQCQWRAESQAEIVCRTASGAAPGLSA